MRQREKVVNDILERYRLICAIHTCYYTQLQVNAQDFGAEFFFLVGDIIEGKPIDRDSLRFIDMARVEQYLKEDHRR
jgi:hypothetical protein